MTDDMTDDQFLLSDELNEDELGPLDNPDSLDDIPVEGEDALPAHPVRLAPRPMLQSLLADVIGTHDPVRADFIQYVVGPLSEYFAAETAKGGKFARDKAATGADVSRYGHDQTMRAHLLNGVFPALHVMRLLAGWGAARLLHWDATTERLFMTGYMLHDYNKFGAVKDLLKDQGFDDKHQPGVAHLPLLESITREWMAKLGLDDFLAPITQGNHGQLDHDVMYVAFNTQKLWQTMKVGLDKRALSFEIDADRDIHDLAADASTLADLVTYVARTPREMVHHTGINALISTFLGADKVAVGKLVYHHVAENRGLLLNLIHNGAVAALEITDQRVPLLYAPSGVVYLERNGAPPIPAPDALAVTIARSIRDKARAKLIATGKGAARGGVGMKVDDSYNGFFDLPTFVVQSLSLIEKYILDAKTAPNKTPARLEKLIVGDWPGADGLPAIPPDKKDSRVDQIAEWAALLEMQFTERLPDFDLPGYLLPALGVADLRQTFDALRAHPAAVSGGGIKFHWFLAGLHAVVRHAEDETRRPDTTQEWLQSIALGLARALPDDLPERARIDPTTWDDLTDYIGRVLSLGGNKAVRDQGNNELSRYSRSKGRGGKKICAICGSEYQSNPPKETVIAFQPTVYTSRLAMGSSNAVRNICTICALEQLLRQLFMLNLDSGSAVEGQRVRYISIYPCYFFTPETLRIVQRVYLRLKDVRLSGKEWRDALNTQAQQPGGLHDIAFWQRLEALMLRAPDEAPSNRIVRYTEDVEATFFMEGFRNFNDPTDTESWILPTLFALILSLCLDVKVVTSESAVPLMLEADEMAETIWMEGAHPSVMALLEESRLSIETVPDALARLAAAYLIHLDTEYAPPKEQWQRFSPIAHSLAESPLYVFHHLKRQERDDRKIGPKQIGRYLSFADRYFDKSAGKFMTAQNRADHLQGDQFMSLAKQLVYAYRGFYRAEAIKNANSILRPINVVADALLTAGSESALFTDDEARIEVAYGEIARFMDRVGKGLANGRFPKGVTPPERDTAMRAFAKMFVEELFTKAFRGNVADLRGKKMNLLRSACEYIYRDEQNHEWAQRGKDPDEDAEVESSEIIDS